MVTAEGLTLVDTDVFVIDLRYRRDPKFAVNRRFLRRIAARGNAATSIFNLLELCGILSFNLNEKQLGELFSYFERRYSLDVLPSVSLEGSLPTFTIGEVFEAIGRKMSFGDALIATAIDKHAPGAARFVSWNAAHFAGKLRVPTISPREFLRA